MRPLAEKFRGGVAIQLVDGRMRTRAAGLVVLGAIYGLAVMALMSFIALPIIGQGDMPKMVGWPTFSIEHALYGGTLGVWLAVARVRSHSLDREVAGRGIPVT